MAGQHRIADMICLHNLPWRCTRVDADRPLMHLPGCRARWWEEDASDQTFHALIYSNNNRQFSQTALRVFRDAPMGDILSFLQKNPVSIE